MDAGRLHDDPPVMARLAPGGFVQVYQGPDEGRAQVRLAVRCRQPWCKGPEAWDEVLLHVVGMTDEQIAAEVQAVDRDGIDCQRCRAAREQGTFGPPAARPEPPPTLSGVIRSLALSAARSDIELAQRELLAHAATDRPRFEAHVRELLVELGRDDPIAALRSHRTRRAWERFVREHGIETTPCAPAPPGPRRPDLAELSRDNRDALLRSAREIVAARPLADHGVTVPLLSHDIACEAATLELARDRGVIVEPGTHAVVRLRGVHDDADLDAAPEVITYEVIPADSPALARWIEAASD